MSTIACQKNYSIQIIGCDCSISWFPSVGPCRLRIQGYFDGLVPNCVGGVASAAPPWDGTLSRWDPPPINVNGQYAASIAPPATSMAGKVLHGVTIQFTGAIFTLGIDGDNSGVIVNSWTGQLVSTCPIGVYNFTFSACGVAPPPATLTIEGY